MISSNYNYVESVFFGFLIHMAIIARLLSVFLL